jgi:serine/threonine protein kinase
MGEVYLARDTRLGRPVALKVLPERFALDERFRERLLRESRLAASLDHPNVVPVYDAGEADGRLFIAMRYVDGVDLKALLRDAAPLAPERVMNIADQLAEALDAAHQRGLVHRDVKPGNVLLAQQGDRDYAYLADFGLTQTPATAGPADGQFMGTVDYVAPEQIRGDVVDGRADQYALGCLLFECLTGSLPFRDRSEVAAIFAHLEEPPRSRASATRHCLPQWTRCSRARWRRNRRSASTAAASWSRQRTTRSGWPRRRGGARAGSCRCSPSRSLYPRSPPWRSASAAGRRRALRGRTGRSCRSIRGRTASAV